MNERVKPEWFVYMLRCADGSLYTGITTDLERRIIEHNSSVLGAKYTRGRRPVRLVYKEKLATRALASKKECFIKRLSKKQKELLV
ncbi:MAG: GIY-YIG nuclease family protein [Gammaproteobacteria bacterium]|nr:GIY-YIG nuclease family protein [Gammaproteobacteria bacterium]